MKKIFTSIGMIVFVGALVVGGTGAFFSDTETSTGNTFAAGEIDLKIDNSSYGFDWNNPDDDIDEELDGDWIKNTDNSWELSDLDGELFFSFEDLKPGDYGEDTISLHVQNDAWACMAFNLTGTPENGVNDPEAGFPDLTVGANEGELQNYLEFVFWNDDGDNVLEVGETVIQSLSGLAKDIFTGTKLAIADSSTGNPLPAAVDEDDASYIGKGWCFGDLVVDPEVPGVNENGPTPGNTGFTCNGVGNHNDAQTDGIVVDVAFEAVQARHNDNFLCTPREPETGSLTVDKIIQLSDLDIEGVDIADFELHILGPDGDKIVLDQVAETGLTAGEYTVSEIYSDDPDNVVFEATFGGDCAADGTVTLNPGDDLTCTITNVVSFEEVPQQGGPEQTGV